MAVRRIRQLGDPILREHCRLAERPSSAAVRLVADDLRDTLKAAMAAPQIGAPVRVIVVDIDGTKQRITLVNPEITDVGSEDFEVWDDCFCFPGLLVRVNRAYRITANYVDLKGKPHTIECVGPMAELLQHEIDHLDGILALDHPAGVDPFAFRVEWDRRHDPSERYGPPRQREAPPD
jgi:peptide deformylase